jgi:hypothetical protein
MATTDDVDSNLLDGIDNPGNVGESPNINANELLGSVNEIPGNAGSEDLGNASSEDLGNTASE